MTCGKCNGSGEGLHEGDLCPECNGSGEEFFGGDDDDFDLEMERAEREYEERKGQ